MLKQICLIQADSAEAAHAKLQAAEHYIAGYDFVEMGNGWCAVAARLSTYDSEEALTSRGFVVWPHVLDNSETLQDGHHKKQVPPEAGIATGDTPFSAVKKLHAHLRFNPLKPTVF
jgi:hypothetical protein